MLAQVADTLPDCPCGGRLSVDSHSKCRKCAAIIPNKRDPVERLDNPHMYLVDGALLVRDKRYHYEVCIGHGLNIGSDGHDMYSERD